MKAWVLSLNACDRKEEARKYILRNHRESVCHLYALMKDMFTVEGEAPRCYVCNEPHFIDQRRTPHWTTGGLPCQALARIRHRQGHTAKTGAIETHPDYMIVMREFDQYLDARTPDGFCIEEVPEFNHQVRGGSGETHLTIFAAQCVKRGYCIRAGLLDHGVWSEVPEIRIYCVGVRFDKGGSDRATWIMNEVSKVHHLRKLAPPTPLFGQILSSPDDADEVARRDLMKERFNILVFAPRSLPRPRWSIRSTWLLILSCNKR